MATTIITKSGSGAPLAGDLQVAELALDLTNKKLYSKEGTTVFEVGATGGGASGTFTDLTATNSFTSVGIDDNATSTAITIDASENVGIGTTSPLSKLEVLDTSGPVITLNRNDTTIATDDVLGSIEFYDADGGSGSAGVTSAIKSLATGSNGASVLTLSTSNSSGGARAALAEAVRIDNAGNVGIGTTSPVGPLHIQSATNRTIILDGTVATGSFTWQSIRRSGTEKWRWFLENDDDVTLYADVNSTGAVMRWGSDGNVGIGTTSPSKRLHIDTATNGGILLEDSANSITGIFYSSGSNSLALGSTSNHPVKFFTNNSERMRLDASGNVGIGTTSPSSYSFDNGPEVVIGDGTDNPHLSIVSPTTGTGYVAFADGTTGNEKYRGLIEYVHTTDHMGLRTGGTERMRIDSSGDVSIGTDSCDFQSANRTILQVEGTTDSILNLSDGTNHFYLHQRGAGVDIWSNANYEMRFGTNNAERMRIDSSGILLVGTTSTGGVTGGSTNGAYISGSSNSAFSRSSTTNLSQIAFYNPNGFVGQISTSGTTTIYSTSSDVRLKENIVDAPAGNIDAIRVRSFDWKADGSHQTYGMVAQELVDVAPEAVTQGETEDDMWSVDYSKLVPMMIKEIQDLKAEVAALKGA